MKTCLILLSISNKVPSRRVVSVRWVCWVKLPPLSKFLSWSLIKKQENNRFAGVSMTQFNLKPKPSLRLNNYG